MSLSRPIAIGDNAATHFEMRFISKLTALTITFGIALLLIVIGATSCAWKRVCERRCYTGRQYFYSQADEGLPSDGNFVEVFEPITEQTFFEGLHSDGTNPDITTDDTNINADIMSAKGPSAFF